ASSIEGNNSNWAAAKAIDGNTGTRWSSAFSDPQWLAVDLGASKAISKVVLSWQNSYSTDYDIQVSATGADGSWTTVYTQPNGDGGTDEIANLTATGRYVRMYSRHRKTQYGNSLWEVKVYEDTCPCQDKIQALSATASSIEGSNWVASKSIDGNFSSRWSSAFSDPQWLSIDLGAAYDLNRVVLHWQNSASADYDLQVSANGTSWTTIYTNSNGQSSVSQDIPNLTAQGRYLRVYSRARITQYGVSLWEVEAFQETCNTCTPTGTSETVCNGVDDDCDGAIDENYAPTVTNCGVGACAAAGMTACVNGAVSDSCTPGTPAANDATCNGVDNDCSGQVDEDFVGQATSCGVGACAATGTTSCVAGSVVNGCSPGTPAANDVTCNDVDDDCDGMKDENYPSQPSTCGVGACAATGTLSCLNGSVVDSCAPSAPADNDASCNGVDDDCNGAIDEDYPIAATSCGVGACSSTGLTTCQNGSVVDSCTPGAAAASDATCNGVDDDCDGAMDENYVSVPTSCGVGGCTNAGATSCVDGAVLDGCVPLPAAADDSLCDGVDSDCDGDTDEGYEPVPAACGVGACASTGVTSCVSGAVHSSCVPGSPAANDASCDGVDNDCNSETDEDYVSLPTSCGLGECAATGATSCTTGTVQDSCTPGNAASNDSLCDGLDNDCNGDTDEDYVPHATSCGVGACADTGVTSCVAGSVADSCSPGEPALDDMTCDLVDDDCDGQEDEDYLSEDTACGVGACARAGATSCVDGDIADNCTPGAPTADDSLCDGLDNDCNGETDEDYVISCAGDAVVECENGSTVTTSCSNDDVCDGEETCSLGVCGAGTPPEVDDTNPCTVDTCEPQDGIAHTPATAGTPCTDDGNVCNGSEVCDGNGTCVAGTSLPVDDGNPCTADACDPVSGVTHTPVALGTACNDSTVCNGDESCNATGICVAGAAPIVDDGNPCTSDACDPVLGATHAPVAAGTACLDATVCNGSESCDGNGTCTAGTPPVVDDFNPCTADECDPLTGPTFTPHPFGTSCSDGDQCNGEETCDDFATCVDGDPLPVDDDNLCTTDVCDPVNGVSHTPVASGTSCSDGNPCNGTDELCNPFGQCFVNEPTIVDDNNPCTIDACDPQTGVTHTPAPDTACGDGNACNGQESCDSQGVCVAGAAPMISDGNPCTADTCDAMTGVHYTPLPQGTTCADGNVCNGDEQCDGAGSCSAGSPIAIDDQDSCTFDSCDPVLGEVHTPVPAGTPCDDGDRCNGDDECNELGVCVTTNAALPEDDENFCTLDFCDPETGEHVATCTPVNATVASIAGNNLSFIYQGPDAPQTGLDPDAIDIVRAGAITGLVLDENGIGVAGVRIRAL
ncbi:MAG TPA: discoidin domain-containing protein, partial [Polyangiaceae bacterium]|nr:discoidin domain-containing protein [Polyangiaceae bacterium]